MIDAKGVSLLAAVCRPVKVLALALCREALLNSETLNGGMSAMSEEKMTKLTDAMWKEKVMSLVYS